MQENAKKLLIYFLSIFFILGGCASKEIKGGLTACDSNDYECVCQKDIDCKCAYLEFERTHRKLCALDRKVWDCCTIEKDLILNDSYLFQDDLRLGGGILKNEFKKLHKTIKKRFESVGEDTFAKLTIVVIDEECALDPTDKKTCSIPTNLINEANTFFTSPAMAPYYLVYALPIHEQILLSEKDREQLQKKQSSKGKGAGLIFEIIVQERSKASIDIVLKFLNPNTEFLLPTSPVIKVVLDPNAKENRYVPVKVNSGKGANERPETFLVMRRTVSKKTL